MYSKFFAYLLWFLGLGGWLGLHRFYLGKYKSGILYMMTGGLFTIGMIYDFFTLGRQVDDANLRLRYEKDRIERREFSPYPNQVPKKETLEHTVLRVAQKNKGKVSASQMALEAGITLDKASQELDKFVAKGIAEIKVRSGGSYVYVFPDFYENDGTEKWEL